jgi:rhamnosyl/mannosyltransferase
MYGIPLVVTNLGEIYSHRAEIDRQLPMIRHVVRVASMLTSLTRHCASSYGELGLSPEVRVLPYGIDRERFALSVPADRIRQRFAIPLDADVALFLGRLTRDMGVQVLLDALPALFAGSPSVQVLIAGASGELREAVAASAARWPGHVHYAVDVPEEELPQFYAAATVVVAPTLGARACGSLAAAEAMAAGKPVVATRIGGIPEYVSHGETGLLVPPGDAPALAEAVLELLRNRPRLTEFGRQGRERAAALFDGERTSTQIERLFREVAGRAA